VVHAHADHCIAISCLRRPIPPFHQIAAFGGDDAPCASDLPFGSAERARETAEAREAPSACLLGSHGMTCRSPPRLRREAGREA
jgi:L-fuculose-phosphate aldolase